MRTTEGVAGLSWEGLQEAFRADGELRPILVRGTHLVNWHLYYRSLAGLQYLDDGEPRPLQRESLLIHATSGAAACSRFTFTDPVPALDYTSL
jgi:hypothetical protein